MENSIFGSGGVSNVKFQRVFVTNQKKKKKKAKMIFGPF